MMEMFRAQWLSIGVGIFLLAMVLYGHYRGFVRMAVTVIALILSLTLVQAAMPCVSGALKENTTLQQAIGQGILHMVGIESAETLTSDAQEGVPARQREIIEHLKLPEQMKEVLLENNNNEIYRLLGVDAFMDYLGSSLANMVLNLFGSIILFALSFFLIRLLLRWFDVVADLPIISGINHIAGALLGGAQGLFLLWLAALIVKACSGTSWSQAVLEQVNGSLWLSLLYHNNLFDWLLMSILKSLV